jgi:hypothetical protein
MQTRPGWIHGYNAHAAVTENHIVIAAELTVELRDFGHLSPVVRAAELELEQAGVTDRPGVVLADAGCWHTLLMEDIVTRGTAVIVPPDAKTRDGERPGLNTGMYAFMRAVIAG